MNDTSIYYRLFNPSRNVYITFISMGMISTIVFSLAAAVFFTMKDIFVLMPLSAASTNEV